MTEPTEAAFAAMFETNVLGTRLGVKHERLRWTGTIASGRMA